MRFLLLLLFVVSPVQASPQRVASLNMCLDPLLLMLLPREKIASLTYLSAQPQYSAISDQLAGLHLNHGQAEELVPLQPDLILAGEFGAGEAVALMRQLGYRVELVSLPRTLEDIASHIRQLGQLLDNADAAEAHAAALEANLAALDNRLLSDEERPRAVWYAPNGFATGQFTLEDELMQRAGYRNLAAEQGLQGFVQLDVEALLTMAPDVLIVEAGYVASFSLAREYLQHPVLQSRTRQVELPAALSVCVAPQVVEALQQLISARSPEPLP